MSQIPGTLAEHASALIDQTARASAWLDRNRALAGGEFDGLQAELRRAARIFRTCRTAATRKMCVGVFGPSQAGKSYLISALARDADGTLMADFAGAAHDFLGEINPEGGKESTGLVTRFTVTDTPTPPDFPVRVRLLTETDLVKILANTYYADCEHRETPDGDAILARLAELETEAEQAPRHSGSQPDVNAFEDLWEYLETNFQAKPRVQELRRTYRDRAPELGPRLSLDGRIRLYSLIWNETPAFTEVLRRLTSALEALGFPDTAYCPLAVLIPRERSIIDVNSLADMSEDAPEEQRVRVLADNGRNAALSRALLTALTAELTIVMRHKPDTFFEHTDLLDFPGYRSRYKLHDLAHELNNPGMLKELFLRGKVAYLFQRYAAERELSAMLLCIGPSNQEVQDLPIVINEWIALTHGATPEDRAGKPTALFMVLTKFDMEFEQKRGAPSVDSRWDNRLHASLLDFFGKQHDWPTNWDGHTAFNNMFLLRNPNFRFDSMLEIDENGVEQRVRPDQQKNVDALENAFLASPLVAAHFADPRVSWEAAMRLNDGGIGLIRERLRPACDPRLKSRQLALALDERAQRLAARLAPLWKTDDREEERQRKTRLAYHLLRDIFGRMSDPSRLAELVRRLGVTDQEVHELCLDAKARLLRERAADSRATIVGDSLNVDDLLHDLFGDDPALPAEEAPAAPPAADTRFQDEAAYLAAAIESWWLDRLHALAENPELQQRYSFPAGDFAAFVNETAVSAARLGLRARMEQALRAAADYANIDAERLVWKQASLAAALINAHVDFLGYDPQRTSEEERSIRGRERATVLFAPRPLVQDFPILSETRAATVSAWKNDWLRAVAGMIAANACFEDGKNIDPEQNRMIGEILRRLRTRAADAAASEEKA